MGNTTQLGVCDPNCFTCHDSNPASCITCIPGYYLATASSFNANNGYCVACNISCFSCVPNSPNQCLTCYAGAFYNEVLQTCTSCVFPCITCIPGSNTSCTSCASGYLLQNSACLSLSSSAASSCSNNCATCQTFNNVATCTNCNPGYVLSTANQCVPCMQYCSVCTLNQNVPVGNQPVCIGCSPGYFLNQQSSICQVCGTGCLSCYQANICYNCMQGYTQTASYTCVPKCNYPCTVCAVNNPNSCTACQAGFYLNTATNTCMSYCTSNSTNCTICPIGSSINVNNSVQTCVTCAPGSNCFRCDSTNPSVCISCAFGFYLNSNSVCVACSQGCTNCLSLSVCFSCGIGYIPLLPAQLVSSLTVSGGIQALFITNSVIYQPISCVACVSPCATCISNQYSCLTCISGYTLAGTSCISNFNFNVNIYLSPVTPSAFMNNYYNFLIQVAGSINQNVNSISVSSIVYGSANITMSVNTAATQGSSQANAQQQNLTSLAKSSTIASMPVLTSSVSTATTNSNGGSTVIVEDNTTTIILAVVIPVCVVCKFYII